MGSWIGDRGKHRPTGVSMWRPYVLAERLAHPSPPTTKSLLHCCTPLWYER